MLKIENLTVEVKEDPGNVILRNLNLHITEGEIHVLFGPNGSGKSTLIQTIMGFPQYNVVHGSILFKGKDITYKSITERAKMGIGISFQRPPNVPGLKLNKVAEFLVKQQKRRILRVVFQGLLSFLKLAYRRRMPLFLKLTVWFHLEKT